MSDYVRRNEGARTSNTINIGGSVASSNLAVGSQDVAQSLRTGVEGEELAALLRAVIEAIPSLALSPADKADLEEAVRQADNELSKASPDQGWVKSLLKRTGEVLATKTATALGPVLAAYLKHLAIRHGIPLDN